MFDSQLEAAAGGEAGEAAEAGGIGDLGGGDELDLGGEADEELGADLEDIAGGDEGGEEGGEESPLLAAPGKREGYVTPGSKGKVYTPVTSDSRGMGARKRSFHGSYNREAGKNTTRNIFKGYSDGLSSLAKGITESQNYGEEHEKKIFELNHEVQKLIEDLEKKDNEK